MKQFEYRLVRSKRKTLALYVLPDASVEIRAPLRMPASAIEAFAASKRDWIEAHVEAAQQIIQERERYSAGEGEAVLFLGKEYPVRLVERGTVRLEEGCCLLPVDERARKKALTEWYRREAERRLPQFLEKWKSFTEFSCRSVTVGSAASRGGSCTSRNDIRLSWRLILLPEELIDYVVVHELCHTVEHNHSPAFWKKVESVLPGAAAMRKRLRQLEEHYAVQINWLKNV